MAHVDKTAENKSYLYEAPTLLSLLQLLIQLFSHISGCSSHLVVCVALWYQVFLLFCPSPPIFLNLYKGFYTQLPGTNESSSHKRLKKKNLFEVISRTVIKRAVISVVMTITKFIFQISTSSCSVTQICTNVIFTLCQTGKGTLTSCLQNAGYSRAEMVLQLRRGTLTGREVNRQEEIYTSLKSHLNNFSYVLFPNISSHFFLSQ